MGEITRVKPRFSAAVRWAAWAASRSASAFGGQARIDVLLAGGAGGQQLLRAVQLHLGVGQGRRRVAHLRLGLLVQRLVGARVDLEQQLALGHGLPVLEPDRGDVAGDSRPHVDARRRFELADEVVPVLDLALKRLGDDDGRRRRRGGLARAATRDQRRRDQDSRETA
jgi:hypothetical protein